MVEAEVQEVIENLLEHLLVLIQFLLLKGVQQLQLQYKVIQLQLEEVDQVKQLVLQLGGKKVVIQFFQVIHQQEEVVVVELI